MKKLILVLLSMIVFLPGFAQQRSLQALFSYKSFYLPGKGPYVETYLSVNGRSVQYNKNANGKFQGAIEINLRFTTPTGEVAFSDRYNLLSPELEDTLNNKTNFLDQQRIQIPNGQYKLELSISDKNSISKPYTLSQVIPVEFYDNILSISEIELVDTYAPSKSESALTKSGFDVIPFVDNYYPHNHKSIKFYAEVYNADKVLIDSPYLLSYFVESSESKQVVESMRGFIRTKPERVSIMLREINISDLPSGNYNLVIEARNQQNELLTSRSVFIQRSNLAPMATSTDFVQRDVTNTFVSFITNKDSLIDYINCLYPIASPLEQTFLRNQLKLSDISMMQRFFYDFWAKRNPANPEKVWLDYRLQVLKVNQEYSTKITPGYATDRGRVYLQYGPPNTMSPHYSEPSAYPYEIWHYYKIGTQTNKKFVFYDPDLVMNDFVLLHSDAQGELSNSRWELELHKRDTQSHDFDKESKGGSFYGNQAKDQFQNPR